MSKLIIFLLGVAPLNETNPRFDNPDVYNCIVPPRLNVGADLKSTGFAQDALRIPGDVPPFAKQVVNPTFGEFAPLHLL